MRHLLALADRQLPEYEHLLQMVVQFGGQTFPFALLGQVQFARQGAQAFLGLHKIPSAVLDLCFEFLGKLLQAQLRFLPIRDVEIDTHHADSAALRIAQRFGFGVDPSGDPVWPYDSILKLGGRRGIIQRPLATSVS